MHRLTFYSRHRLADCNRDGGGHQRQRPALPRCASLRQLVWADAEEYSSGSTRTLGRISKRGDRYLGMLLTHGARSVLRAAAMPHSAGKHLDGLRQWALALQARSNHNKAACALANKLARIFYATLRDGQSYDGVVTRMKKKMERTAYAMPA